MIEETLKENSLRIEEMLVVLRQQVKQLRKYAVGKAVEEQMKIAEQENQELRQKVAKLKKELISLEVSNGVQQVPLPGHLKTAEKPSTTAATKQASIQPQSHPTVPQGGGGGTQGKGEDVLKQVQTGGKQEKQKKSKQEKAETSKGPQQPPPPSREVDVSLLDMRVGRITAVQKHPDADSLYVEEVDVGGGEKRTIVSGLVAHVPIEQMKERLAVFLLNLKPAKMRGVLSQGMIMCASTPEKVEIIEVPEGVAVGERVVVRAYPGEPEETLNPKKKHWEAIQPHLRINHEGLATYKGELWGVGAKGVFKAPTLKDTPIK